jgi:hypothetical protein
MATAIRPLTLQERGKPAKASFHGGFRNVTFQLGELVLPSKQVRNLSNAVPAFAKGVVKKTKSLGYPILIPNSLSILPGVINIIATVVGQKNAHGGFDAVLVARATDRLSSLNTKMRTVEHLIASRLEDVEGKNLSEESEGRLGKSFAARNHNQVMLAGLVVGSQFEDGQYPRFHIFIRQDANPNNVIPLVYEARNATAMVGRIKYGAMIYVDGEYVARKVPTYELDESGARKLDANGEPIKAVDAEGNPITRVNSYIRITAPKDPAEFDLDFGVELPKWMKVFAAKMEEARNRTMPAGKANATSTSDQPIEQVQPEEAKTTRRTTFIEMPGSIDDL